MFKEISYEPCHLNFPEKIVNGNKEFDACDTFALFQDFVGQIQPNSTFSGTEYLIIAQRYQSRPYKRNPDLNKPLGYIIPDYEVNSNLGKWKAYLHTHTFGVLLAMPLVDVLTDDVEQNRLLLLKAAKKMGLQPQYEDGTEFNRFNNEVIFVMEQNSLKDIYILGCPNNARKGAKNAEYHGRSLVSLSQKADIITATDIDYQIKQGHFVLLSSYPQEKQPALREWAEKMVSPFGRVGLGNRVLSIYFTGDKWSVFNHHAHERELAFLGAFDSVSSLREKLFQECSYLQKKATPKYKGGAYNFASIVERIPTPNVQAEYQSLLS